MTDHDDFDELASAHLDGTTSADEAARVAADPALQARVEELRRVREAVGTFAAADPAGREAAIGAALAAFAAEEAPVAPVTSLAAVAARRAPSPQSLRLLGAVAAVLALIALVPLLGRLGTSDDDASTASEDEFHETGGAIGDSAEGAGEPEAGPTSTTAGMRLVELGRFDDLDALVDAVREKGPFTAFAPATQATDASGSGADCPSPTSSDVAPGSGGVSKGIATVAGDRVVAIVTTDADGARTLRVFAADGCTLLAERRL